MMRGKVVMVTGANGGMGKRRRTLTSQPREPTTKGEASLCKEM